MADILIVDDDPDTREALSLMLLSLGHHVRIARDGEEGLREVDERIPDLVLLDLEMPVLGGIDMAYQMFVRDVGQDEVPILLISGAPELRTKAIQVGTPYFLSKPFNVEILVDTVNRALRERISPVPAAVLGKGGKP